MEWIQGNFVLSDERDRVDVRRVFELLGNTYWGVRRPYETVERMVQHSVSFTLFHSGVQIGFGRGVTDYTVFSWVADIAIDAQFLGQGLGKRMRACIKDHPLLRHTQKWCCKPRCSSAV
jgi:hypothetical protein